MVQVIRWLVLATHFGGILKNFLKVFIMGIINVFIIHNRLAPNSVTKFHFLGFWFVLKIEGTSSHVQLPVARLGLLVKVHLKHRTRSPIKHGVSLDLAELTIPIEPEARFGLNLLVT